jgi:uncharacterized cupredoxin-like copper-binding protein
MMRWVAQALLPVVAVVAVLLTMGCGDGGPDRATVGIRFSRFDSEPITARVGEPITLVLRNDDPIEHEWIIGQADVHQRHRTGTEPYHDEVPTEVTIPALETRETTLTFDRPGEYQYICHLPGHEAYGMVGTLRVLG